MDVQYQTGYKNVVTVFLNDINHYNAVIIIKVGCQATRHVLSTLRRLLSVAESGRVTDENWDDLWTADDHGDTVVHWASRLGCCRTLGRVLTADLVSVPNQSGVTPLHVAADRGLRREVEVRTYRVRCT